MVQAQQTERANSNPKAGSDRADQYQAQSDHSTQHIDRIALMKEGSKESAKAGQPGEQASSKGGKNQQEMPPMTDIYKETGARDNEAETRGLKGKKSGAEKTSEKPKTADKEVKPEDKKTGEKKDEKKAEDAAKVLNPDAKIDPNKPTIAFVDNFKNDIDPQLNDGKGVQHGEFSARAAEQQGFNVYRVQENGPSIGSAGQTHDYSKALNSVADKIDKGELKMGKGDAVNVSLGQNPDMSYKQAREFLGMKDLNADNLKEKRPQIMDRLNQISNDPSRSADDRATAKAFYDTNKAIDRLQAKGIRVVQAAGNGESDVKDPDDKHFSMDFMQARDQLSSNKPDGTPDKFAANSSLTKPGNGVFGLNYRQADLSNPEPIAQQQGNYQPDDGTPIRMEAKDFGGTRVGGNKGFDFDRSKFWDNGGPPAQSEPARLDKTMLKPELTGPNQSFDKSVRQWDPGSFSAEQATSPPSNKTSWIRQPQLKNQTGDQLDHMTETPPKPAERKDDHTDPIDPADPNRAAIAAGTSFSNIRFYPQIREEMLRERREGQ